VYKKTVFIASFGKKKHCIYFRLQSVLRVSNRNILGHGMPFLSVIESNYLRELSQAIDEWLTCDHVLVCSAPLADIESMPVLVCNKPAALFTHHTTSLAKSFADVDTTPLTML
jgi:hypothetical protein